MKAALGLVFLMALAACSTVSRRDIASDTNSKGIACESEVKMPANSFMKGRPRFTVLVTNISKTDATVDLSDLKDMESGGLPDRRHATLQLATIYGISGLGYVAAPSTNFSDSRTFTLYTDGTNAENTKRGVLSLQNPREEFNMNCADGSEPKP